MSTYILTSPALAGAVEFRFDPDGALQGLDIRAELTAEQRRWLRDRLPASEAEVKQVLGRSRTAKLSKLPEQKVTFEHFWHAYDDKALSSKKGAATKWAKMSAGQQQAAFAYIRKYFAALPPGTRKKYAETYLNAELWNN